MLPVRIPDEEIPGGFSRPNLPIAAGQFQYEPLPALHGANGAVLARWQLTEDERRAIEDGANIELTIFAFGRPLQPHYLVVQGVEREQPLPREQVIEENRNEE